MIAELAREATRCFDLADEAATAALARAVAALARPRDVIALWGDLGAGKTRFARGFVAALAGDAEAVPSPTFTLVQTSDTPAGTVWHFDLYRLDAPEEALELGLEEALAEGISLIEWPDRLGGLLPEERLDLALEFGPAEDTRRARLTGRDGWAQRLAGMELR